MPRNVSSAGSGPEPMAGLLADKGGDAQVSTSMRVLAGLLPSHQDCKSGVLQAIRPRPSMTGADGSFLAEYLR